MDSEIGNFCLTNSTLGVVGLENPSKHAYVIFEWFLSSFRVCLKGFIILDLMILT